MATVDFDGCNHVGVCPSSVAFRVPRSMMECHLSIVGFKTMRRYTCASIGLWVHGIIACIGRTKCEIQRNSWRNWNTNIQKSCANSWPLRSLVVGHPLVGVLPIESIASAREKVQKRNCLKYLERYRLKWEKAAPWSLTLADQLVYWVYVYIYIYVYISERIVKRCCYHIFGWFIWNADLSQVVKSWRIFVGTNQAEERQWTSCSDSGHRPSGSWTTTAVSRGRCVYNLLRCFQPLVPGTSQRDRVSTAPWISRESRLGSVIDDHTGQKWSKEVESRVKW